MKNRATSSAPATRRIGDATGFNVSVDYLMAALLGGAAIGVAWWFKLPLVLDPGSRDFNPILIIPLFLGAFALKFLCSAMRGTLLERRFGASSLEMEGESVSLGGTLKGRIRTSRPLTVAGDYAITLRCIDQVQHTNPARPTETRTEDVIQWEALRKVPGASVNSADGVPFEFAIPDKAFSMPDARSNGEVRWTLEIRARQQGLDYYALFGVIVRPKGS